MHRTKFMPYIFFFFDYLLHSQHKSTYLTLLTFHQDFKTFPNISLICQFLDKHTDKLWGPIIVRVNYYFFLLKKNSLKQKYSIALTLTKAEDLPMPHASHYRHCHRVPSTYQCLKKVENPWKRAMF